jgi:hypothetical protein
MEISPHGHGDQTFTMVYLFLSQKMANVDDRLDIPANIDEPGKIVRETGDPRYGAGGKYFPDIRTIKSVPILAADKNDDFDPLLFYINDFLCAVPSFEFVQDLFAFQLFF